MSSNSKSGACLPAGKCTHLPYVRLFPWQWMLQLLNIYRLVFLDFRIQIFFLRSFCFWLWSWHRDKSDPKTSYRRKILFYVVVSKCHDQCARSINPSEKTTAQTPRCTRSRIKLQNNLLFIFVQRCPGKHTNTKNISVVKVFNVDAVCNVCTKRRQSINI